MNKINGNTSNSFEAISAARQNEVRKGENETSVENKNGVRGADKIELSGEASKISRLVDRIRELPDVREDKVNALKAKIEAGEFNPTSDAIADAILKSEG
jgi:negative regulator of flagellin synthesis FlgM